MSTQSKLFILSVLFLPVLGLTKLSGQSSANLALNKPGVASTGNYNLPRYAFDGNSTSTRWESEYYDPQWIYVDLGAVYSINRVKLTWEAAYGKDYLIQVSTDAATWVTIKTVTNNSTLVNDLGGLNGTGRYVRMYGTTRGIAIGTQLYGYSLYEFEVYSVLNPPTITIAAPVNGTGYVAPAAIIINAEAAGTGGNTITKVDFYNGNTLLGSDGSYPYSYTWSSVLPGTYSLTASATDNANSVTSSSPVSVTVNVNPNTISACSAPSWNASTVYDVAGKQVTYQGKAYENRWYSVNQNPADNNGPYAVWNLLGVCNIAPNVSITSPSAPATFTAPGPVVITAGASDPDGTISKVEFYNGTDLIGSAAVSPYTLNWTGVAPGNYTVTAKAYDNGGMITSSTGILITVKSLSTLPIKLLSFKATRENGKVLIKWTTAPGNEAMAFEVQRSQDGSRFVAITTVASANSDNEKSSYDVVDNSPVPGISYYRLKQTSMNGTIDFSKSISVNSSAIVTGIRLLANPVKEKATLILPKTLGNNKIVVSLTEPTGRVVAVQESQVAGSDHIDINLSGKSDGLYIITVSDKGKMLFQAKMVKN